MAEIWVAAATVAVGAYSAYSSAEAEEDARKDSEKYTELGFQRERWLNEQNRGFELEDRQYVEDSIGGFRGFAPESSLTFNGQQVVAPTRTSTDGLADFNPNVKGAFDYLNKPKPLMGSVGGYE